MIESFGISNNKNEIGVYAGMVTSAFAFAEFSTGMMWGKVSDCIGRKPVLLIGLAGTLVSMLVFGFAKSFSVALIARALGGGLNGNISVIQTTVAELVREKEHQPRAFAINPFIWCLGSIIGPAMGGLLAEPTRFYPHIFPPGGILEEYPFLLPNVVASVVLVLGILIGILFLEETHEVLRLRKDPGRELGQKLLNLFRWKKQAMPKYEGPNGYSSPPTETQRLLQPEADLVPNYQSAQNSGDQDDTTSVAAKKPSSFLKSFTRPVVVLIFSYGILAYHTMGFDQLLPVFLSTPAEERPHHLFKFIGGLGMTTQTIGFILSMQGLFSMSVQFIVFPPMARHFGIFNLYRFCLLIFPISYFVVPYIDWLPKHLQMVGVYAVLALKNLFAVIAYPCNAILLTNSVPSFLVLGTINGVAASCASFARAFAPTLTGMLYSVGLDYNMVGLAWWVNGAVCVIGGLQVLRMKHEDFEVSHITPKDLNVDEEAVEQVAVQAQIARANVPIRGFDETFDEYNLVRSVISDGLSRSVTREGNGALPLPLKDNDLL